MRLKRWESPRREGRNDKGRGGSARQRQLKKQQQRLRQKLKEDNKPEKDKKPDSGKINNSKQERQGGREFYLPPCLFVLFENKNKVCERTLHKS
ncbi:hypothetical protein SD81_001245 [Tolypothrix campylonemoides VB511288]|nr:hypothetical protein SD81_001245 [Tolypothrix campylonemoides VB511288]